MSSYSLKMEVSGCSKMLVHLYTHPEEEDSRSLLSNKLHGVLSLKNIIFCYFVVTCMADNFYL
jgi:ABC-type bacteriocin/lantibiotic exporter with double-glycine peptidase domain